MQPIFETIPGQEEGISYIIDTAIAGDGTRDMLKELEGTEEKNYLPVLRRYCPSAADIHILRERRIVGEPMTISVLKNGKVQYMVKILEFIVTKEEVRLFIENELDDPAHYAEALEIL